MKNRLLVAMVALLVSAGLQAVEKVTLKAAKSSSSYYQMAVGIGENIKKTSKNTISITIEESQGSVQNVKEAKRRAGNYMFTTPPILLKLAKAQKGPFKKDNPKDFDKVRSLFPIPYLTMHFVVRKDSNINKFEDLNGKTLLIAKGTYGGREAVKYIKALGLEGKVKLVKAELSNAVAALKNGQIDAFATSGSYPAPNVIEAVASADVALISLSDEQIAKTKRDKIIIPANTYAKITKDISTTTLPVGVYTTTNMSESLAYNITKDFWESKPALDKQNSWWKSVSFENLSMFKTKLHKGALKYYEEQKVNIPKDIR